MTTSRSHSHYSLPAPVVHAGFSVSQSKSHVLAGVQDAYWSDDEAEDAECPLCLEEMDISDLNFKPCICGYQICRFCWHHIKENLNKRCPACRRIYTDDAVEFKPIATKDHKRLTQQKKQRERERKELDAVGRRHLANVRVVQRNVVYVVGIGPRFAKEELIPTLRSNEYFGQYGKITKILIVKRTPSGGGAPVIGLYITYYRREDAARAIAAVDGAPSPGGARGEVMRASHGTTKYCMAFLRGVSCGDHSCMNLHEWGDEKDCFTKEDLTTLKHTMKATESRIRGVGKKGDEQDGLPRAASWAHKPTSTISNANHVPNSAVTNRQTRRAPIGRQPRITQAPAPTVDARPSTRTPNQDTKTVANTKPSSHASVSRPTTPVSPLVPKTLEKMGREPTLHNLESSEAARPGSPDLLIQVDLPQSGQASLESSSSTPQPGSIESSSVQPTLPPGLPIAPPGLPVPPSIISSSRPSRFDTPSPQTPLLASQSSYQMSTAARALLDDVKARRELASSVSAGVSPFPDLDRTLQTLSGDGGFSFNLDPALAASEVENSKPLSEFNVGTLPPFRGSYIDAFPALRISTASDVGITAAHNVSYPHRPSRSTYDPHALPLSPTAGPENLTNSNYIGSFNPFADSIEDSPAISATSRPQYPFMDNDSSRQVSRYGFARGRQGSTAASSPLQISSPLSNGSQDGPGAFNTSIQQENLRNQPFANGGQDQQPLASRSPIQQLATTAQSHSQSQFQPFDSGVSEAQLRSLIQSSRDRAQLPLLVSESHPSGLKPNQTRFNDPAIMSARFASEGQLSYGPPPGLFYSQTGSSASPSIAANIGSQNADGSSFTQVFSTAPSLPLALSSSDFPALIPSSKEPSSREDYSVTDDSRSQQDARTRENAERKAAKKEAAAVKAAERQKVAEEKAVHKAAERAKAVLEKQAEKEKKVIDKSKVQVIKEQENVAREQVEREKAANSKIKASSDIFFKERLSQTRDGKPDQTKKVTGKQDEEKRFGQHSKSVRQVAAVHPSISIPEPQIPLLSKMPKKNKPHKPARISREEGRTTVDAFAPLTATEAIVGPTGSSSSNSRSHSLDRGSPTPVEDLLEDIHNSQPDLDLPNHPIFDIHKTSPAATVPLEYGPLVHALSALSVGGGSFANSMPSGSIDNAVSSFQQLLETLTQTISDLLRLLPRTTWDDSSSFDGVLRDMLKGDDFLDDVDEGHGKEDEVTALTLALERRARWMEVQLSKLEELHRDINTAAVRAVLSFNDNGWDRSGFLPRVGHTLPRFDSLGSAKDRGELRMMTADELEKELSEAETEVRKVVEDIQLGQMQTMKPIGYVHDL